MHVWHDTSTQVQHEAIGPRSHPWTEADDGSRYVDFKAQPELVESACLDFEPFTEWPEIQAFFELLRWVNGPSLLLESNDCAFAGPAPYHPEAGMYAPGKSLVSSGRLMLLYRHLPLNTDRPSSQWLIDAFIDCLKVHEASDSEVIDLYLAPVRFVDLPGTPLGQELVIRWWTWGNNEEEIRSGFGKVVSGLRRSIELVSAAIPEASEVPMEETSAKQQSDSPPVVKPRDLIYVGKRDPRSGKVEAVVCGPATVPGRGRWEVVYLDGGRALNEDVYWTGTHWDWVQSGSEGYADRSDRLREFAAILRHAQWMKRHPPRS